MCICECVCVCMCVRVCVCVRACLCVRVCVYFPAPDSCNFKLTRLCDGVCVRAYIYDVICVCHTHTSGKYMYLNSTQPKTKWDSGGGLFWQPITLIAYKKKKTFINDAIHTIWLRMQERVELMTEWKILQHTATYCNTLQLAATRCTLRWVDEWMKHTATHCNTLQHTATHCITLQHTAARCTSRWVDEWKKHTAPHCNTLQHTATHCITLQHTTARCTLS